MIKIRPLLLIIVLAVLSACGGDKATGEAGGDAIKVFHYNQPNNITSLDPAFARSMNNIWAIDHLFNGLVQLDEQLNVQAAIANKWTISEDGTTYTFTLREDVYFHDDDCFEGGKGRKVVAQDFVYSFGRILDNTINSPGSWLFKGKVVDSNPFTAPDDQTFVVKLKAPFRPMLGIMSMQYCVAVPKEAVDTYGKKFREHPVGTGPFKFKKWIENQSLFLSKNPNYFEMENGVRLPYLDGVRVSFIADRKTAYLELMNGKIDFFSGMESSFVNELLTPDGTLQNKQSDQLQFLKSPFLNTEYLGFNLEFGDNTNPLRKKKVRQALNYAIDRDKMLRTLRNGVGKAANAGFTPVGLPSFSAAKASGYSYNPDKARQLLKEAGFENGKGMGKVTLLTNSDYEDLCTFIVKQWEDLGVKVQVDLVESATLRQMNANGQSSFFRASWIADYPDAESFFTVFYGKNPSPPRYTRFKNAAFDKLYEAALNENDDAKRYDLYQAMDRILIDEAPVVFLYYDETALFARKGIQGLSKNATNLLSVKRIKK